MSYTDKARGIQECRGFECGVCKSTDPKHGMVSCAMRKVVADMVAKATSDAVQQLLERATCIECKGTGTWENPANGRRSPCSRGCVAP